MTAPIMDRGDEKEALILRLYRQLTNLEEEVKKINAEKTSRLLQESQEKLRQATAQADLQARVRVLEGQSTKSQAIEIELNEKLRHSEARCQNYASRVEPQTHKISALEARLLEEAFTQCMKEVEPSLGASLGVLTGGLAGAGYATLALGPGAAIFGCGAGMVAPGAFVHFDKVKTVVGLIEKAKEICREVSSPWRPSKNIPIQGQQFFEFCRENKDGLFGRTPIQNALADDPLILAPPSPKNDDSKQSKVAASVQRVSAPIQTSTSTSTFTTTTTSQARPATPSTSSPMSHRMKTDQTPSSSTRITISDPPVSTSASLQSPVEARAPATSQTSTPIALSNSPAPPVVMSEPQTPTSAQASATSQTPPVALSNSPAPPAPLSQPQTPTSAQAPTSTTSPATPSKDPAPSSLRTLSIADLLQFAKEKENSGRHCPDCVIL